MRRTRPIGRLLTVTSFALVAGGCSPANSKTDPAVASGDAGNRAKDDVELGAQFDVSGTMMPDTPLDPDSACAKGEAKAERAPVDIIIAIDQSGSMNDDIARVKANINNLSGFLEKTGFDYRVVLIARPSGGATDAYGMCMPTPLGGPSCGDNPPKYRRSSQEVQSTDALKLILSTYDSTSPLLKWADTLRMESTKAFIVITDDNASAPTPTPVSATFDTELLKRGSGTFGTAAKRKYVFFPICGASATDASVKCGTNVVNTGPVYVELAKLTGGKWFPLCSTDFGPLFTDMAKAIAGTVACELNVPSPPSGESINYDLVNVNYTPSAGGTSTLIPQDASKPCAGGADGWQYNADKTKILICGPACATLQGDPGAKVSVEFGCGTKVR